MKPGKKSGNRRGEYDALAMQHLSRDELYHHLFAIFSYQFDETFAEAILTPFEKIKIKFSRNTGKIKELIFDGKNQANYRGPLGTFSISLYAAQRILSKIPFPQFRVQVLDEVAEFITSGKSVFAQHIVKIDPNLHVGEEVFVVDSKDNLLAIGKLNMPPHYFPDMQHGTAVKVRKGIAKLK